jgi:hypothetical protein
VGCTASSFTSLNRFAAAVALLAMAAIQPWSAAGAENPMVTVFPVAVFAFGAAAATLVTGVDALLLVQAVSTPPALSPAAPSNMLRRPIPLLKISTMYSFL